MASSSGLAIHLCELAWWFPTLGLSFPICKTNVLTVMILVIRHRATHEVQEWPGSCFPFPFNIKKSTWAFQSCILGPCTQVLDWMGRSSPNGYSGNKECPSC